MTAKENQVFENLIVGCGSRGLVKLCDLLSQGETSVLALEASSRIGGTQFLISRTSDTVDDKTQVYDVVRTLPDLKIWWDRNWVAAPEVDWTDKDWAYVLPQWMSFFNPLVELKVKDEIFETVKDYVKLEQPVGEIKFEDGLWELRSGEKTYRTKKLHWTLGLKALQSCLGKKEAEEFMEKNPDFNEAARDAEGVLVANYSGAQGEPQFLGIPVRHEHKLYLTFVSIYEGQAECFVFLHSDLLKQPKDLSFFEKSIRRTLKHTLSNLLADPTSPTLGVFSEARGFSMASPWRLKDNSEKGIYFVVEKIKSAPPPEAPL